ncbi:hypothetical protein [Zooshikella ganghwensis]|uniref:hypothetical protein n=1 Tax=Zooshikella ganghwensis TaxID=202772 RepID=UPI00047F3D8E|nr:hypothetical protein [Zooshikella ganghwensis]
MIGRRKSPGGMFHPLVPPLIELRCKCGGKIICQHPLNAKGYSDTPDGWFLKTEGDNKFSAKCDSCSTSKRNLNYFELEDLGSPYYSASVGSECIWGWNKEHFKMIIDYLEGKDIENNRWRMYRQFIPGKWKAKSRRDAFVKTAKKALNVL